MGEPGYSTESDSTVAREFANPFAIAAHEKRSSRKVAKIRKAGPCTSSSLSTSRNLVSSVIMLF
jgi:hypothetical protein